MTHPKLEELLLESARLARRVSRQSCHADSESGENCAWYHGFLPYLRLLGLVATPAHHADFFIEALGLPARAGGQPRVLISGAADHYMLAQVREGCLAHGLDPRVTVLDLCETPLTLNRWYAERSGFPIETLRSDILDYANPGAFDIICTHSLLGRFSPGQRPALMASWRRLLAAGGRIMTVNRVRVEAEKSRVGFNQGHSRTLHDTVLARAEHLAGQLDVAPLELARQADIYSTRHSVHPVKSREEVRDLFEGAGFEIERLDVRQTGKSEDTPVSGPTMLDGSHYACIVARNP